MSKKTAGSNLKFLQESLQMFITQADGFLGEEEQLTLENCIQSKGQLSAAERVNIYKQSYFVRLFECFQAEFPCLEYALGTELFRAFAFEYLQKYPSTSYTLYKLGDCFPKYLKESRPDAHLPSEEREQWPDFIIELATLESAFSKVYIAKEEEDSTCVLKFNYPVRDFFKQWRAGKEPELPRPAPQEIVLTRKRYVVEMQVLKT